MDRQTKLLFLLGAAGLLWALSRTQTGQQVTDSIMANIARGIRNNNPGNIRKSKTVWAGQSAQQTDTAFVQFTAPEFGIRAMAKVLKSYFARGVDTLEKVVATWAPPGENDTEAYIRAMVSSTGIPRAEKLTVNDLPLLVSGLIRHENGTQPYPVEIIQKGVSLA